MDKHTMPTLPSTQFVLEDLWDQHTVNQKLKTNTDDETIKTPFSCYHNFNQLKEDLQTQSELSLDLDQLNKKIVDNIERMKKHA